MAAKAGEIPTAHYLDFTHKIRNERLIFEKKVNKNHKTVKNQKYEYSECQLCVLKKLSADACTGSFSEPNSLIPETSI